MANLEQTLQNIKSLVAEKDRLINHLRNEIFEIEQENEELRIQIDDLTTQLLEKRNQ